MAFLEQIVCFIDILCFTLLHSEINFYIGSQLGTLGISGNIGSLGSGNRGLTSFMTTLHKMPMVCRTVFSFMLPMLINENR